jgi:hypothetical protein
VNHGFFRSNSGFRDIMAVGDNCTITNCLRANQWSNPSLTDGLGQPTGVAAGPGVTDPADMTAALNQFVEQPAAYMTGGDPAPSSAPSPLWLDTLCYAYDANWTAPTGTVGWYELYSANNSSFVGESLRYRGPDNHAFATVSTTTYFRVRACNANGCGSFSNTASGPAICP